MLGHLMRRSPLSVARTLPCRSPITFPTKNVSDVHQQAIEASLPKSVAVGRPTADLSIIRPVVPLFRYTPEAWVVDFRNEKKRIIELDPYLFNCKPRRDILHQMVVWQLAKRRQGTHKTLFRDEVAYSKRKLRPQKHMGRARVASKNSPIFRGGGHAHPKRPRDYSFKLNAKIRRLAFRMALTTKAMQGRLMIVENASLPSGSQAKTRVANEIISGWGITDRGGALIVDATVDEQFRRTSSNLSYIDVLPAVGANVYDILRRDKLILTVGALEWFAFRFKEHRLLD